MQANYLSKTNDEWIPLQIKVFSRWVTKELKGFSNSNIQDVTKDLSNGVALVELAEVLTHRNAPHLWDHKPTMKVENVQNCDLALDMFIKDGVKLVGISGKDISDNNQKLIMGLIWSLILHYSIDNSMLLNSSLNETKINNQLSNPQIKPNYNPQDELLSWAIHHTNKYQNVNNFEPYDLAMCALLDSFYPDKIKFNSLEADDHEHNAKLVFDVMNELGIACFIYPEDLKKNQYKVDERTLLTQLAAVKYVSDENEIQQKGREIAFSSPEELRIKKEVELARAKLQKENEEKEQERQKELEEAKLKAKEAEKLNAINQTRLRIQEILHAKAVKSNDESHQKSEDELKAKIDEAEDARRKAELYAKEVERKNLILEQKLKDAKAKLEKNQIENNEDVDAENDEHETHKEKHVRIKIKVHHDNDEEEHKKYKIGIKVKNHHNENGHEHHHLVCKNIKVIRNGKVVPSEIEKVPVQNNGEKQSFHVKLL